MEDGKEPIYELLQRSFGGNSNIYPKIDLKDLLRRTMRRGVVAIDPPDGFFVEQGCLAISHKAVITGGLGPCVALVICQAGSPNFLAHVDSFGFREHTIQEIAAVIKEHFDPTKDNFKMEVHNWQAFDELKGTVIKKVSELAIALGQKPEDVSLGIPFVEPVSTFQLSSTGEVANGMSGQKRDIFSPSYFI